MCIYSKSLTLAVKQIVHLLVKPHDYRIVIKCLNAHSKYRIRKGLNHLHQIFYSFIHLFINEINVNKYKNNFSDFPDLKKNYCSSHNLIIIIIIIYSIYIALYNALL